MSACIAEASALRYTPAGLPALDFKLEHESEIPEAGQARQVMAAFKAVAFGAVAEAIRIHPLGSSFRFTGFLINARTSKGVVFHIQALHQPDPVEQVPNPN